MRERNCSLKYSSGERDLELIISSALRADHLFRLTIVSPLRKRINIVQRTKETIVKKERALNGMSAEELKAEIERLKDNLCDLEDMHSFSFGKTSVHIGAEKAQNMQVEFEEECRNYKEKISEIEKVLKERGAL